MTRAQLGPIVAALVTSLGTVWGCGDSDGSTAACSEGEVTTCEGSDGCSGEQTCTDEGEFGACVCSDEVESESSTEDAGTTAQPLALGAACSSDDDCPADGFCLAVDSTLWLGGAPPEGLCVADCSLDETVCDTFADARCISATTSSSSVAGSVDRALCLPSCAPNTGSLDSPACGSAPGTVCEPSDDSGNGFCRPVCFFDEDCSSGYCDRQLGICVATEPTYEVPFGSVCSAADDNCDGVCVELSAGYSVCSERCLFGTIADCATYEATPATSVCAYAAVGSGLGDLGYCAELCNCNDDCSHLDFICDPFPSTDVQTALGYVGICAPPVDSTGQTLDGTAC